MSDVARPEHGLEIGNSQAGTSRGQANPAYLRWVGLAALLLAEIGALTVAFDAGVREDDPGSPGRLIYRSPHLLRGAVVALLVTIVLGWWYFRNEIRAVAHASRAGWTIWLWTAAHLAAFALFTLAVTPRVLGEATRHSAISAWDVVAWLVCGVASMALLAAAAVSPRLWPRIIWRARWVLTVAILAGAATDLVARSIQEGWETLARPTLWVSYNLLHSVADDAVCDPDEFVLGTSAFRVKVTAPCSGYEGMGLIALYLGGYLWLFRRRLRFPDALIMLPLGMAAVWLANAIRLAGLVLIGDRVSPSLALGGFHSQAGWLTFNAVALGLVAVAHRSHFFRRVPPPRTERGSSPTVAYLTPITVAIAVQLLASAFLSEPGVAYPLRAAAAALLLWYFWPQYDAMHAAGEQRTGTMWAIVAGIVVFAFWAAMEPPGSWQRLWEPITTLDGLPTWMVAGWVFGRVIGFVIITPLVEELAFRGYLMRRLIASDFQSVPVGKFTWLSFLVSSVLFGVLHGDWLAGTTAGMVYAGVVYRTGRLRDAIVAHAVTNGLLVVAPMVGHWLGR
jgi:exosortase E/protease (VPEID-CTERM system)